MKLSEKTPPSLFNMPLAVLHNILDYVKPTDRLVLRKVSRRFRDAVDDRDPGFKNATILIKELGEIVLKFDELCIFYRRSNVGCTLKAYNFSEKTIKNGHYLKLASTDFKMIINNPKLHLESFEVVLGPDFEGVDRKKTSEIIRIMLKSVKKVDVGKLTITGFIHEEIPMILQYFGSDNIQDLKIDDHICFDHIGKVVESNHWKKAKSIHFIWKSCLCPVFMHLTHFSDIQIHMKNVSVHDANRIIQLLQISANFKSLNITTCCVQDFLLVVKVLQPNFIQRVFGSGSTDFAINGKKFHVEFDLNNIKIEKKIR
ncbi:F-box domain-containing protein [Caenorhabditis elegans]|uniref:F-box domain-containing protein n=2 Tax=Caenorhabditis elegans TaxID=6239 RepID=Q7YTT2_CAEEL|nr:F-box domain-containing protein [Caenorhabditis elegans]CAE11303.1 F-box domain-containing protein [Caenorhabditis elegans]|eukprot:NP_001023869.1 F-box A protein [Caenorhabditis elegans]